MSDTTMDPKAIAQAVAVTVSDEDGQVGDFVEAIDLGDNVTDTMMSNWTIGRSTNHPWSRPTRPCVRQNGFLGRTVSSRAIWR